MNITSIIVTALVSAVVTAIVTGVIATVVNKIKHDKKKERKVESGIQCLLRAEIIRQSEKWLNRGFCPIYAKDALVKEYESYHELGGNGTITEIYHKLIALPDERPKNHKNGG